MTAAESLQGFVRLCLLKRTDMTQVTVDSLSPEGTGRRDKALWIMEI